MKNTTHEEYLSLVKNILNDEEFIKLKDCPHHGTNRYDHSMKVSYIAYKISKKYNLSYEEVARSALLHDFFYHETSSLKDRFKTTFTHPLEAENNAREKFNISEKEAKIIRCHMFPINLTLPKDKESWIVTLCDKAVYLEEYSKVVCSKFKYSLNILALLLFNFIK